MRRSEGKRGGEATDLKGSYRLLLFLKMPTYFSLQITHYPLKKILNTDPDTRAQDLILRWISDPMPTRLDGLKFVLKSSPEIRKKALEAVIHIIREIIHGEIYYDTFAAYPKSLGCMRVAKKKLTKSLEGVPSHV